MKFDKRHLVGSVVLLVGSIAYNVWVFSGRASLGPLSPLQDQTPLAAAGMPPDAVPAVDPAEIPAPPPVDLDVPPVWGREPFMRSGASDQKPEAAPAASVAASEPVVRSILFSPERRLALLDTGVVRIGDRLPGGGTVTDITRDGVTVRMPDGVEKRLLLRGPATGEKK